ALVLLSALSTQLSTALAQGTAFTYQGQLQNNGSPASGTYNLTFTLFNTNATGVPVAGPVTNNAVGVTNGLFTVLIDFGAGVFIGGSNWLEIAVETNPASSFTTLAPRQELTPTPYAITAENFSGVLPVSELPNFQPPYATIGGGTANVAADSYSTVAGGIDNSIQTLGGSASTIGGGYDNSIPYQITSVSPFEYNYFSYSTIGGGVANIIYGNYATIGGGADNTAAADYT